MANPCRQAERWMALQDTGELDADTGHLLREHLAACGPCRQQSKGLSSVVSLLREESFVPRPELFAKVMDGVQRERLESAPIFGGWRPLAVAGAVALSAVVIGAVFWFMSRPEPEPANPMASLIGRSTSEVPRDAQRLWRVMIASGANSGEASIDAGAELATGDEIRLSDSGIAVLISGQGEVVVADGGSHFSVRDQGRTLELTGGTISVISDRAGQSEHQEISIVTGEWTVQPVGTEFSVRFQAPRPPHVRVSSGEVRVQRDQTEHALSQGTALTSRGERRDLSTSDRQELSERLRLAQQLAIVGANRSAGVLTVVGLPGVAVSIDGFSAGAGQTTALLAVGSHQVVMENDHGDRFVETVEVHPDVGGVVRFETSSEEEPSRRPTGSTAPSSQESFDEGVREVERLLSAGSTAQARTLALRLLERHPGANRTAALRMLVAESHVRDGSYERASEVYLGVHRQYRRSAYGGHSLYMAGSLELFQRGRPGEASRLFQRYLSSYPRGRQRQGAYNSLIRALRAQGRSAEANQTIEGYIAEFPNGRYRDSLAPSSRPPQGQTTDADGGTTP